jgi:hypothetical protein
MREVRRRDPHNAPMGYCPDFFVIPLGGSRPSGVWLGRLDRGYGMSGRKSSSGPLKPQRLASSSESSTVAPAAHSAQFRSTSSTGELLIGH